MPAETRGETAEGIAPEFARYRRLKKPQEFRHGQRQKTLRATGRAPVLPPFRRSGGCRRMSPCPETPCPEIGCPARGIPAPVLRIRSGRSRRRSGDPVLPAPSCSPGATPLLPGRGSAPARAGGIARPRVSSAQMSGCRWLITGLTCAGPVRPVTPPASRRKESKAGNDTSNSPALHSDRRSVHAGTFRTGTGVRQEIAGLHSATDTATDRFLYPGNFPPVFPLFFSLNFRRNPGETGWQHTARTASHTAGFLPCRSGAVLCRVISGLKIGVFNRDALPGRIYPRIHGKSLQAYFIIHFGYSGWSDPYPQSPGKPPGSLS